MVESFLKRPPVAVIAGFSGVIQSLVWLALTVVAQLGYYCVLDDSKNDKMSILFHKQYFYGCPKIEYNIPGGITSDFVIHICMWLEMVSSFAWFASSVTLLRVFIGGQFRKHKTAIIYVWVVMTSIMSVVDIVLASLFGKDLRYLLSKKPFYKDNVTISGALMAIAMRGFVLWIFNVACLIYLAYSNRRFTKPRLQGSTSLYDNVVIPDNGLNERQETLKGLPRTPTSPTLGSASLGELLSRYAIHSPNTNGPKMTTNIPTLVNDDIRAPKPMILPLPRPKTGQPTPLAGTINSLYGRDRPRY